jgi:hypothetical protein
VGAYGLDASGCSKYPVNLYMSNRPSYRTSGFCSHSSSLAVSICAFLFQWKPSRNVIDIRSRQCSRSVAFLCLIIRKDTSKSPRYFALNASRAVSQASFVKGVVSIVMPELGVSGHLPAFFSFKSVVNKAVIISGVHVKVLLLFSDDEEVDFVDFSES